MAILVAVSGFASGTVFFLAISEADLLKSPATLLPVSLMGAVLFFSLWLAVAAIIARRAGTRFQEGLRQTGVIFSASLLPLLSYFPYLFYRTGSKETSVEPPPLDPRNSAIILLIWSLLLLTALLRTSLVRRDSKMLKWISSHPGKILAGMMVSWLTLFFTLDVLKDHYMNVTTVNSALFREAMLHIFDERGFMYSNLLFGDGASVFGVHVNAILIFVLPVFRLWPDYRLLLLVSDIALALSAIPAYLIARRHFSSATSLLLAAMMLFHPIMTAQPGRSDFSELRFMPVLFLTAFWLFEKRWFWTFAAVTFLMMTIREDMGLFVAFFGIYALVQRRSLKWILGPVTWGLLWFLVSVRYILPGFSPSGAVDRAVLRYSSLGSSGSEIIKTLFFKPWKIAQAALATPSHIGVAYGLILTFGLGIPLLSAAIILAIPVTAEIMFQQQTNLVSFMSLPAVPIVMVAFIYGLAQLVRIIQKRWNIDAGRTTAVLGITMFFISTSAFHTWFNPQLYQPRYNYDVAKEALSMIPDNARVILPEFMLIYAKPDQTVRGFHQMKYQEDIEGSFKVTEDYILLDRRVPANAAEFRYYKGLRSIIAYLLESPDYSRVFGRDDVELYVRNR